MYIRLSNMNYNGFILFSNQSINKAEPVSPEQPDVVILSSNILFPAFGKSRSTNVL